MNLRGRHYEDFAIDYLKKKGYEIIERNFALPDLGEVDIIAKDKLGWLIFIEVRGRKSTYYSPYETINRAKVSKIIKTSLAYLKMFKGSYEGIRYDVISIEECEDGRFLVEHLEGAFQNEKGYYG